MFGTLLILIFTYYQDLDELVEATTVETHTPVEDALATAIREKQELQVKFSELCSSFAQYKNFVQEKVLGERLNAVYPKS